MKISVVTISYNSASTIGETIESVLRQKDCDLEYIVVDGASEDGTAKVLEQYEQRIDKLIVEKDEGIYHAMNKGVKAATGQVVGVLNSDDIYAHNKVLAAVNEAMETAGSDALYGDLDYVQQFNTDRRVRSWRSGGYNKKRWKQGWMPPHPTFFLKKEFYDQYGGYRTDFKLAADYELMLRMLYKHRLTVIYIPGVMVKMRMGGASNSSIRQRLKANQEDRKAWRVNGLRPAFYTNLLKPLRKITQWITR